jgi:hypothetical protein
LAPADFSATLGDVIIKGEKDTPVATTALASLRTLTDQCIAQHKIPMAQQISYAGYVFDVVMHAELTRRLAARGVPVDAIDEALGFGPGRANVPIGRIEAAHLDKMTAAAKAKGYDLDAAPDDVVRLLGMYIGARSGLAEDLAGLR